ADRPAVVVVEEDRAVGLGVAHEDTLGSDYLCDDRAYDVEGVDLVLSGLDLAVHGYDTVGEARLGILDWSGTRCPLLLGQGRLQPFVDTLVDELSERPAHDVGELIA